MNRFPINERSGVVFYVILIFFNLFFVIFLSKRGRADQVLFLRYRFYV